MRQKYGPESVKIVRKRLADGTVKEYRYQRTAEKPRGYKRDSLGALIVAYQTSPEWAALAQCTRQNYSIYLRTLADLKDEPVHSVTRRMLLILRDAIASSRGIGAATGFVRAAKVLFGWARDREWIDASPALEVKMLPGGHLPAWTPEQARQALAALPEYLRRVVVLGMHTGQRRGDLISLEWSAYDGRAIRLVQQKTKAALVLPVNAVLRGELDAWRATATGDRILMQRNGLPFVGAALSAAMSTALQRAGLPARLNVHGLRKLLATNVAQHGGSASEIAAFTGHKTLKMVALYTASVDQERLARSAMERMETGFRKPRKPRLKAL